jgi:hypothetical protein
MFEKQKQSRFNSSCSDLTADYNTSLLIVEAQKKLDKKASPCRSYIRRHLLGSRKGEALSIGISIKMTLVVHRRGKGCEVAVVSREFGCLDTVRGGGATKGTVQASHLADLRRIEVEQNRRHAAPRGGAPTSPGAMAVAAGGGGDRFLEPMEMAQGFQRRARTEEAHDGLERSKLERRVGA